MILCRCHSGVACRSRHPPSAPVQRRLQGPPAKSNLLAVGGGEVAIQDKAIINSISQPIAGVPRDFADIRISLNLDKPELGDFFSNDFSLLQESEGSGLTAAIYGRITPLSPPSDPARRLVQGPPAKSKLLAAQQNL